MWRCIASYVQHQTLLPVQCSCHRQLQQTSARPSQQSLRRGSIRSLCQAGRSTSRHHQTCRAQADSEVPDDTEFDWVARNEKQLRALPLGVGGIGVLSIVANRIFSQGTTVPVDAGFEGRAELLATALCAVLLLVGLQWLSVKPRALTQVEPIGKEVAFFCDDLPESVRAEVQWTWQAVQTCSRCRSLVVLYRDACVAHLGSCKKDVTAGNAHVGAMCRNTIKSGKANNLANLARYPGAFEFGSYLPVNTQSVLIQPIGQEGVLVLASDYQRGFGRVDQKLDSALEEALPKKEAKVASATSAH